MNMKMFLLCAAALSCLLIAPAGAALNLYAQVTYIKAGKPSFYCEGQKYKHGLEMTSFQRNGKDLKMPVFENDGVVCKKAWTEVHGNEYGFYFRARKPDGNWANNYGTHIETEWDAVTGPSFVRGDPIQGHMYTDDDEDQQDMYYVLHMAKDDYEPSIFVAEMNDGVDDEDIIIWPEMEINLPSLECLKRMLTSTTTKCKKNPIEGWNPLEGWVDINCQADLDEELCRCRACTGIDRKHYTGFDNMVLRQRGDDGGFYEAVVTTSEQTNYRTIETLIIRWKYIRY